MTPTRLFTYCMPQTYVAYHSSYVNTLSGVSEQSPSSFNVIDLVVRLHAYTGLAG